MTAKQKVAEAERPIVTMSDGRRYRPCPSNWRYALEWLPTVAEEQARKLAEVTAAQARPPVIAIAPPPRPRSSDPAELDYSPAARLGVATIAPGITVRTRRRK